MTQPPSVISSTVKYYFPQSLLWQAEGEVEGVKESWEIQLNQETLTKIHQQAQVLLKSAKRDSTQKFSSQDILIRQCFIDLWEKELVERVITSIRSLKDHEDYCLVNQKDFDEGLEYVKSKVTLKIELFLVEKAKELQGRIAFPFDTKVALIKNTSSSKVNWLRPVRELFSSIRSHR